MGLPKDPEMLGRIFDLLGTDKTTEVASLLEIAPATVSDWKNGRSSPTIFHLTAIANLCDSTTDWLVSGEGPRTLGISVDGTDVGGLTLQERQFIREMAIKTDVDEQEIILMFLKSGLVSWGIVLDTRETTLEIIDPLLGKLNALDPEIRRGVAVEIIQLLQARLDGRSPAWYNPGVPIERVKRKQSPRKEASEFYEQYDEYMASKSEVRPMEKAPPPILVRKLGKVDGGEEEKRETKKRKKAS